jgi:hypothetical protein
MIERGHTRAIVLIFCGVSISFIIILASWMVSNVHAIADMYNDRNIRPSSSSLPTNGSPDVNQTSMNMTTMKMVERGDIAMGFNKSKITHHFVATPTGGEIIITAINGSDSQTISQIKNHVLDIQKEFSEGNFTKPFFIHAQQVPGSKIMSEKKNLIKYDILEMNNGSSLLLTTNDNELISAIRQFMEFQAREHYGH